MNKIQNSLFRSFFLLRSCFLLISLAVSFEIYAAPNFTTVFSPTTIGPGAITTLTYTIDNSAKTTGTSDLTFSNTLPTGLLIANPANATSTCTNGIYVATAGTDLVTFSGYRLGAGSICTLTVDVTGTTGGAFTNTTGDLSTSAGSAGTASANLTVDTARPGFTSEFSPASITPGSISRLKYTIDNSPNNSLKFFLIFLNTLPTGLTVSSFPDVSSDCPSPDSITANPESNVITLVGGFILANMTCTIEINVTADSPGTYLNTTGSLSQNGAEPSGATTASLTVTNPFMYASLPATIAPGKSAKLAFTITNNLDRNNAATDINFTDDLNAALTGMIATALPADGFCGAGSSISGSSTITISGANLAAAASCSFEVTVLIPSYALAGSYSNSTSIVSLNLGSTTSSPSITNNFVINYAPLVTATFIDDPVSPESDVILRYTIENTDTANATSAITFTQGLNSSLAGLEAKILPAAGSCGAGSTFSVFDDGSGLKSFMVDGANLAAAESCTFDLLLTTPSGATPGTYDYSTNMVRATVNGATVYGTAASDNLDIIAAPALSLAIVEDYVSPGATITAQFTLNYGENAINNATSVGFSLDLDSVLSGLIATDLSKSDVCGAGSLLSGTSIITLTGASLSTDKSCTFTATLQVPSSATPGSYTLHSSTVSAITSTATSSGAAWDQFLVSGLTFSKSFIGVPALPGSTITLQYVISNAASALAASSIEFTDSLSASLTSLTATVLPDTPCGPISTLSGTTIVAFSGGELQPGESCTFDLTLLIPADATTGQYNSSTSQVSATVNGNNTANPAANDVLTVEQLTVVLSTTASNPTFVSPIPINIDFSRAVNNFLVDDVNITNGTATNFSGSGLSYTFDLVPATDGTLTLDIAANVADDAIINTVKNSAAIPLSLQYSAIPTTPTPSLSISAPSIITASTGPVSYSITYTNAENVNLTNSAITLNKTGANATIAVTNGQTNSPTVTLSNISGNGSLGISITENSARNGTSLAPSFGPSSTFTVDNIKPTVSITSTVNDSINTAFTAIFTFSETVTGFSSDDISVDNGIAATVSGSGFTYTALITPTSDGAVTLDVTASAAQDSAGNQSSAATQYSRMYDTSVPSVEISSNRVAAVNGAFTATFTFSEAVTGFDLTDIDAVNSSVSNFSGSDHIYTATITPSILGMVILDVAANAVRDSAGNNNRASSKYTLNYDPTIPVLLSKTPAHQSTEVSINNLTITLSFNKEMQLKNDAGIIELVSLNDNVIIESLDLATSSQQVTISGNTVMLVFKKTLAPDNQYGLRINSGILSDLYGNTFAGLNESQFNFATNNNAPVTIEDTASLVEDGAVAIAVLANDSDAEGFLMPSSVTVIVKPANGQTHINIANGVITYTPSVNFNGTDTFRYQVADFQGALSTSTLVTITINAQNDLPTLNNDLTVTQEDTPVLIDVLKNDTDIDANDQLNSDSLVIITRPVNGQAQVIDGKINYSPFNNFNGSDSFTYQVADSFGALGEAATVILNISGSNDAPVATDDIITTNEDTQVTFNILINDLDIDGEIDPTTISIITAARHGELSIDPITADIRYLPNKDFNGSDSFGYVVKDSEDATSNEANVSITVTSVNDAPIANNDTVVLLEDMSHLINVLGNDTDVEQGIDPSTVILVSPPSQGQLDLDPLSGKFSYTPAANFFGEDYFSYQVEDNLSGISNIAKVTLTVQSVNDLPIANPDTFILTEDTSSNFAVLANDADIDGNLDESTINIIATTQHGELTITTNGTLNYTPAANYAGNDSFSYHISDNEGGISNDTEVNINITSLNDAPAFTSAPASQVDEDSLYRYSIKVLDPDAHEELTITAVLPDWLELIDNHDGSAQLLGTPDNSQVGEHSINLIVIDNGKLTDSQTFILVVNNINDTPIANNLELTLNEDSQVMITPSGYDPELDSLHFSALTQPQHGQLDTLAEPWIYIPNSNFYGTDSFTYIAEDHSSQSEVATVSINVSAINDRPFAQNDFATMAENTSISLNVLANDSDIDGNIVTLNLISHPASGELILNPDNSLFYTPAFGFDGNISFSYQAIDELGASSELTLVNIAVTNTNTAPSINGAPALSILSGGGYLFMPDAEDIDGDSLSFAIMNKPDWASFNNATGALTGQPDNSQVNQYNDIQISVSDPTGAQASLPAFTIDVLSIDETPIANGQQLTVAEDTSITLNLTGIDPNGNNLSYLIVEQPLHGMLAGAIPALTYIPDDNYTGQDNIRFSVTNGEHVSQVETITITVTPINDAPLANADTTEVIEGQSVIINPLINDTDIDGDALSLVSATAERGSVTITDNQLNYQAIANFVGTTQLVYTLTDNMGETAQASININVLVDIELQEPPQINLPGAISLDATALYTRVDLGTASATDRFGNSLSVSLDGTPFYKPGSNVAVWKTQDATGRTASAEQQVNIRPLISLDKDQTVVQGELVTIKVLLNGDSPVYPLTIPYTVSGSASAELDHDLSDGNIIIESGTEAEVSFNILADADINELGKYIIITLDPTLNRGPKISQKILISGQNIAPRVVLSAIQNGIHTLVVTQVDGLVEVSLSFSDPNKDDEHVIDWGDSDRTLVNQSSDELIFIFDPTNLNKGLYRVSVKVTDDKGLSNTDFVSVKVIDTLPILTTADSDGDGIPDNEEGYFDQDGDGIPDYQDAITACNVLPEMGDNQQQFLVEGELGGCLQLGHIASLSNNAGIQLDPADIPADESTKNIGGIFDFIAKGLAEAGQSYNIVLPQHNAIPIGAMLRKFSQDEQGETYWRDFVEVADTDMIRSAKGERGFCPPPGDGSDWTPGLSEGDWCIQLTLRDGGPNDDDGVENRVIVDPVTMVVAASNNQFPEAVDDVVNVTKDSSQVQISILDNDLDADGDMLSVTSINADLGIAVIQGDSVLYTAPADYIGSDRLIYNISDGNGGSASATVTVLVVDTNQLPLAQDDTASTNDLTAIMIDVLANDSDIDDDTLNLESASTSQGQVQVIDSQLQYNPEPGYVGNVRIEYVISDGQGGLGGGVVRIEINQSNRAPEAKADSAATTDRDNIIIDVLINDTDLDDDNLTLSAASALYGTVSISNNQLVYQPMPGFDGNDFVNYTITDGNGGENNGTVDITVTAYQSIKVNSKSGGSMGIIFILLLGFIGIGRRTKINRVNINLKYLYP